MSKENGIKHPDIDVQLSGLDGNVFVLAGTVGKAMRRADIPKEEIDAFYSEVTSSKSYQEALGVMAKWVNVS